MPEHICNTSPLQYLSELGFLNLLHELPGVLIVPKAVLQEIQAGRLRGYALPDLAEFDWIVVRTPITTNRIPTGEDLGAGETEVLALALECHDPIAVLDDAAARRMGRRLGIDVRTMARQVAGLIREHKAGLGLEHLLAVRGMGLAKAAQILSAFELARRHLLADAAKIAVAADVLPLLGDIAAKPQEHFVCISLNGANEVIAKRVVTIGLLVQSPVHPREVFADVIADHAAAVIFAHNHPSGDVQPSEADRRSHQRLTEAATILGLRVLDHVIVAKKGYFSFQEAGLMR